MPFSTSRTALVVRSWSISVRALQRAPRPIRMGNESTARTAATVEPTRRVARRTTPLERSATKTVYFRESITSWLIGRGPPKLAALVQTVTRLRQIGLYHTVLNRQKREVGGEGSAVPRQYRPCVTANRSRAELSRRQMPWFS